ncbi:three-Cys-motif partner protein TcmP [Campylobacter majalis]|uniref:three-Cys-motif partner protein TcmP n=1 Tax=Campylobacter majalis TaxID=2790656 RepID=UPI003D69DBBC
MAKDMHRKKWDEATLTKLLVFEALVFEWLNIVLEAAKKFNNHKKIAIYDLCCGTGHDADGKEGSPLRIINVLIKKTLDSNIKINIYLNDKESCKIDKLEKFITKNNIDKKLMSKNVFINFSSCDISEYQLNKDAYFNLIFLDQYGIEHSQKINEFMSKGTDILMFISSANIKRFKDMDSFKKYLGSEISKISFEGMTNYETHKVVAGYFKRMYPKYHIAQFSLVKDNKNTNGLIFFSEHRKGQEKFLEAAWKVDPVNGEGNKNLHNDFDKQEGSLFFDENSPTSKMENYKQDLIDFLKDYKSNTEIKNFSLDMGFLTKHTTSILRELEANKKIERIGGKEKAFYLTEKNEKIQIRFK